MGKKANLVVESVLAALIRDVGPHRFAIALNNVCCHGDNLKEFPDSDLGDDDEILRAWFNGVEELIDVGNWMIGGTRPDSMPNLESKLGSGRSYWVVTTEQISNVIYMTTGVRLTMDNVNEEDAEHRFHKLTAADFIAGLTDLRDRNNTVGDLCAYVYDTMEFEVVHDYGTNTRLKSIRMPRKSQKKGS